MGYKASKFFKGNARKPMPQSGRAGETITILHTHVFTEAVASTDVLELFPIPAGARVTKLDWCSENLTGNGSLGWMSGEVGAPDDARTSGTEFANAVANAGTDTTAALLLLAAQDVSNSHRSIGFKNSANIAASAANKLHVKLTLAF